MPPIEDEYELTNWTDPAVNPQYYGYVKRQLNVGFQLEGTQSWLIKKIDDSADPKTVRFASGTRDFTTNWDNRANLNYYIYGTSTP